MMKQPAPFGFIVIAINVIVFKDTFLRFNPLQPSVAFLSPPENIRKPKGFLIFSEGIEKQQGFLMFLEGIEKQHWVIMG